MKTLSESEPSRVVSALAEVTLQCPECCMASQIDGAHLSYFQFFVPVTHATVNISVYFCCLCRVLGYVCGSQSGDLISKVVVIPISYK